MERRAHLIVNVDHDVVSRVATRHFINRPSFFGPAAPQISKSNLRPCCFFPCLAVSVAYASSRYQIPTDGCPLGQLSPAEAQGRE